MQIDIAFLENRLSIFYKTKYALIIWTRNCTQVFTQLIWKYAHPKNGMWIFIADLFENFISQFISNELRMFSILFFFIKFESVVGFKKYY